MSLHKLATPIIGKTALTPIKASSLRAEASLEQVILVNAEAVGLRATNLSLEESILEKVSLMEANLEKLRASDVQIKACDLSAAHCTESSFIRMHISGGRMTGIDLSRSTIKDVVFEDCKLDMANFRFAKLTNIRFVNCRLSETDFQAAELQNVGFESCHMEKVEFGQSKIKQVDARTSQLYDIRGWQSLRGLVIDSTQLAMVAPQLANELGLVIQED